MRGRRLPGPRWLHGLRRKLIWLLIVILAVPAAIDAALGVLRPITDGAQTCRIVQVVDGDTITLWCSGQAPARARLLGFDAPELFSPQCLAEIVAAQKANWALRLFLLRAVDLRMQRDGTDRYGRALVGLLDGDVPLAEQMIAAGHGRAYGGGRRDGWCVEG